MKPNLRLYPNHLYVTATVLRFMVLDRALVCILHLKVRSNSTATAMMIKETKQL